MDRTDADPCSFADLHTALPVKPRAHTVAARDVERERLEEPVRASGSGDRRMLQTVSQDVPRERSSVRLDPVTVMIVRRGKGSSVVGDQPSAAPTLVATVCS